MCHYQSLLSKLLIGSVHRLIDVRMLFYEKKYNLSDRIIITFKPYSIVLTVKLTD